MKLLNKKPEMKKIFAKRTVLLKKIKVQRTIHINFHTIFFFFLPEMEVAWNYIDVGASNSYKWLQKVFILLNA